MKPLFETILSHVAPPDADVEGPLQLQVSALDYSSYVGRIGVGRIKRGRVKTGQQVLVMFGTEEEMAEHGRSPLKAKIGQVFGYQGLDRVPLEEGLAGDIVQVTGIEDLVLGATVTDPEQPEALPLLKVDEPTLSMFRGEFLQLLETHAVIASKISLQLARHLGHRLRNAALAQGRREVL